MKILLDVVILIFLNGEIVRIVAVVLQPLLTDVRSQESLERPETVRETADFAIGNAVAELRLIINVVFSCVHAASFFDYPISSSICQPYAQCPSARSTTER